MLTNKSNQMRGALRMHEIAQECLTELHKVLQKHDCTTGECVFIIDSLAVTAHAARAEQNKEAGHA